MEAAIAYPTATVERLREQIQKLQAAPRRYLSVLRTGVEAFDALLPAGGLPLGQGLELWGEAASGRTSLALRAVAAAHHELRLCAYVDGPGELYPPGAAALGVDLRRLLVVRPPAPGQLAWAATQLLRSGAFACVVLDLTHTGGQLSLAEAKRLADAAGKGGALLLLLTPPNAPGEGLTRLRLSARGPQGLEVEIVRGRQGGTGNRALVPWEALYPQEPPCYRYRAGLTSEEEQPALEGIPRIRRAKAYWHRDGPFGLVGQRPGREGT